MILELYGVVADATVPAGTISPKVPTRQDILLPRGEPLTVKLTVYKQDHSAKDITGCTLKLGLRQFRDDGTAKLTRAATLTTPLTGKAQIVLVSADTMDLSELVQYFYDVQLTEAGGDRYQVIPFSPFKISPIVNRPGD